MNLVEQTLYFLKAKRELACGIYTVTYNTEGILIIFDRKKILKWLNPEEPEKDV
jgi:hypothetical protein